MKKKRRRQSVSVWPSEITKANGMVTNSKVLRAFPGLGTPTRKAVLELAITLGLEEIGRRAAK